MSNSLWLSGWRGSGGSVQDPGDPKAAGYDQRMEGHV